MTHQTSPRFTVRKGRSLGLIVVGGEEYDHPVGCDSDEIQQQGSMGRARGGGRPAGPADEGEEGRISGTIPPLRTKRGEGGEPPFADEGGE